MLTGLLSINLIMHTLQRDLNSCFNYVQIPSLSLASLVAKSSSECVKSGCKVGVTPQRGHSVVACFASRMEVKKGSC